MLQFTRRMAAVKRTKVARSQVRTVMAQVSAWTTDGKHLHPGGCRKRQRPSQQPRRRPKPGPAGPAPKPGAGGDSKAAEKGKAALENATKHWER